MDIEEITRSIELDVRRRMELESSSYRSHLEKQMNHTKWGATILLTITVAAFTVLFGKSWHDINEIRNEASRKTNAAVNSAVENYISSSKTTDTIDIAVDTNIQTKLRMSLDTAFVSTGMSTKILDLVNQQLSTESISNIADHLLQSRLEQISDPDRAPIGTIIASMLTPEQFYTSANLTNSDATTKLWVLANGDPYANSVYAAITGRASVPDLRGMFLRGINAGRDDFLQDPDGEREPGRHQKHSIERHRHTYTTVTTNKTHANDTHNTSFPELHSRDGSSTGNFGHDETRPNNIAVYYYIRVN